jgi:hypothetical protein
LAIISVSTILKTHLGEQGQIVFEGDQLLEPELPFGDSTDNKFIHILIPSDEQQFSLTVDIDDIVKSPNLKAVKK